MAKLLSFGVFLLISLLLFNRHTLAIADPLAESNNKVGINSLSPEAEIEEIAQLVNAGGDWGWIVIVIKKSERNLDRWQAVFHMLAKHHLIPIVRIATDFSTLGIWQRPADEDAQSWADFLSKLYWPTKNRYVQIYNEVNRASEWGGTVDASNYAQELDKTINALKSKNEDFFIMSAPLDLALPTAQDSLGADIFYETMESSIPGIFNKVDGWASHSYPNPDFTASPNKLGRTGIEGYKWELLQISSYLKNRDLPVFITETGWFRKDDSERGLAQNEISDYYKIAFENVWNDKKIVVVAPFVFDFPDPIYHPFSFKKKKSGGNREYFSYYYTIKDLPKVNGKPKRDNILENLRFNYPQYVIKNRSKEVQLNFLNSGNYIWKINENLKVFFNSLYVLSYELKWENNEIFPGQEAKATLKIRAKEEGSLPLTVKITDEDFVILAEESINIRSLGYLSFIIESIKKLI